jgi:MFS family permease
VNRNVLLLAVCQASLMTGSSLVLSSSALVGARLAPSPVWATVPLSLQLLTTMLVMFPAARLMAAVGRRPVFLAAALIGFSGMGLAALGIWIGSFMVFSLAGCLVGVQSAVGQSYRFAAAEAVAPAARGRAISLTLAGGVIAAFVGPNLARLTRDALEPPFFASFLALLGTTALSFLFALSLRLPPIEIASLGEPPRPPRQIVRQPLFLMAVTTAAVGYAVMSLLMTATPLTIHAHGHAFGPTATVIQWHLVAMFAPSFFTGELVRRFGVRTLIAAGSALNLGCIAINMAGTTVLHFELALVLLGIGWNFLYVGGTPLLTETYRPQERGFAQGVNDTVVFTLVSGASLASAGLLATLGWRTLNVASIPLCCIPLLLLIVSAARRGLGTADIGY